MCPPRSNEREESGWLVAGSVRIPLSELRFTFARSSGPGGQNVNKVSSKAQMRWPVAASASLPDEVKERFLKLHASRITSRGELLLSSQRSRDQARNIDDCLEKLRELIAQAAKRPRTRRKTKPGRGAIERRLRSKRTRSARKQNRRRPGMDE